MPDNMTILYDKCDGYHHLTDILIAIWTENGLNTFKLFRDTIEQDHVIKLQGNIEDETWENLLKSFILC